MPDYTVTIRWLNPTTHVFEPVQVRGVWDASNSSVRTLTYRDVYYQPDPTPDPPIIVTARMDDRVTSTVEWMPGYNTGQVVEYHVFRNNVDVSGPLPSTQTTFGETALPVGTPELVFNYQVSALTDTGQSPKSDPFTIQYLAPPATRKPFPPTSLTVSGVTDTSAHLAWQDSTDSTVTGHRVYRNGAPGILVADNLPATARSYDFTGLANFTTLSNVNVRRFNGVGESQASNFVNFTTSGPLGFTKRFPGHLPGLVYMGLYSANAYGTEDTAIGTTNALYRIIDSGVPNGTVTEHVAGYFAIASQALVDGKMPWISILPQHLGLVGSTDVSNWNTIAAGGADLALEQYFDMISTLPNNAFAMLSFHPKPSVANTTDAAAAAFCAAHAYIGAHWVAYNVKENGIFGPLMDSEYWDAVQAGTRSATQFCNDTMLGDADFLGVDLYQNNKNPPLCFASNRLGYIISQVATQTTRDDIMFAVGEYAGANVFRQGGLYKGITIPANTIAPTGAQWLSEALSYFFGNRDRYFALSAFDTSGQSTSPKWALDEAAVLTGAGTLDTSTKMNVYRSFLNGTQIARQQGVDVRATPTLTATLNKSSFTLNETMTLTVTETISQKRTINVTDNNATWTKQSDNGATVVYTAPAATAGTGRSVVVRMTRTFDGRVSTATANYAVTGSNNSGDTFPGLQTKFINGMSSSAGVWDDRYNEVTAGNATRISHMRGRRIFCTFNTSTSGGTNSNLIQQAVADGQLPLVSYKVSTSNSSASPYYANSDVSAAGRAATFLQGLGVPVLVVIEHEPEHQAWEPNQWISIQQGLMPAFEGHSRLSRGFLHNAWLLDNQATRFWSFIPASLLNAGIYEWAGMDTYQAGTNAIGSLDTPWPGTRLAPFRDGLASRGFGHYRLLIGEYNGNHSTVLNDFFNKILSMPEFFGAYLFNSDVGSKGIPLDTSAAGGNRLNAYQNFLLDNRLYAG